MNGAATPIKNNVFEKQKKVEKYSVAHEMIRHLTLSKKVMVLFLETLCCVSLVFLKHESAVLTS